MNLRNSLATLREDPVRSLAMGAALLVVGWLVLYPLVILVAMGMHDKAGNLTFANYVTIVTDPQLSKALANSLWVSLLTTIGALALAMPLAWGVSRTRMPCKGLVRMAVTVAFVIPNFIGSIAWILLLGKNAGLLNVLARQYFGGFLFDIYSMPGLIMILAFSFFPIIYFSAAGALENIDPMYEEAAQMSGAPAWRASLGISLPLILPAIASSSVLVFMEAMAAFGAPVAIATGGNFHMLTTELYDMFSYPPRFELAAAAATPIILFTVIGLWLQRIAIGRRRYTVIGGKAARAKAIDIGAWRWLLLVYALIVIAVTVVLPATVLVRASLLIKWVRPFIARNITFDHYELLFDTGSIVPLSILNSMLTSVGAATAACLLGVIIVWMVERTTMPGRGLISFVSTITFAFPGIALAVGFVLGYNNSVVQLYGSLWLFLIAFTAQRFPFAFTVLRTAIKQLGTELEDAGRMSGASWGQTIRDISVPLLRPGLIAAWVMVFAVTIRELSMAILLYVRGTETLPVAIFSFVDNGTFEPAASLSVLLVVISIISVLLLRRLTGRAGMSL